MAGPDRYLPAGLKRRGAGSTGRALRQSNGPAAPPPAPPRFPGSPAPGEIEAGKSCGDRGRSLGRRRSVVLGRGILRGGEGSPGLRPAPNLPSRSPSHDHPQLEAVTACVWSPRPPFCLPPALFVCLRSGSEVPPSSPCGCLCVYLYISASISLTVSCLLQSLSQVRSLLPLAHFCSLSLCLALLSPFSRHPPHPPHPCLRHPLGRQVGGAAAARGEGGRRTPPPQLLTFTLQASADRRGGGKPSCQLGGGDPAGAVGRPSLWAPLWGDRGPEGLRRRAPPAERGDGRISGFPKAFAGRAGAQRGL